MEKYTINISSKIATFQSLWALSDVKILLDIISISNFKKENPEHEIPLKLTHQLRDRENHFLFCLKRYISDISDIINLVSIDGFEVIRKDIEETIKFLDSPYEKDADIMGLLNESNEYEILYSEFPDGERRKQAIKRKTNQITKFPAKKELIPYFEFFRFHVLKFRDELQGCLQKQDRDGFPTGQFFESKMNQVVSFGNWERFLKICQHFSKSLELDEAGKEVNMISYDRTNNTYIFNGLGSNRIPLLGQFYRKLISEGMIYPNADLFNTSSILKFFSLPNEREKAKYLNRCANSGNKDLLRYFIFENIPSLSK